MNARHFKKNEKFTKEKEKKEVLNEDDQRPR